MTILLRIITAVLALNLDSVEAFATSTSELSFFKFSAGTSPKPSHIAISPRRHARINIDRRARTRAVIDPSRELVRTNASPSLYGRKLAIAVTSVLLTAGVLIRGVRVSLLAFLVMPYMLCLWWGLPSALKVGSWKSVTSIGHRIGGILTLMLPLVLASDQLVTKGLSLTRLYMVTIGMASMNLLMGAVMIRRRVPAYDIPTLRAFAVGVSLGLSFLGHSLLFTAGTLNVYRPFGLFFAAVSVYATAFAWSDAMQHFSRFVVSTSNNNQGEPFAVKKSAIVGHRRFWKLPFEQPRWIDICLQNMWRQPSEEAMANSVSPSNGVVVFTTTMTALFATLSLLQLRYLVLGPAGIKSFVSSHPAFCSWSAVQALLAVVANNFGTFAGTLVIQRRSSQRTAGVFNALGLLIPVVNIVAYLALNPSVGVSQFLSMISLQV